jgi:hypothetical protein
MARRGDASGSGGGSTSGYGDPDGRRDVGMDHPAAAVTAHLDPPRGVAERTIITLSGARQPVVAILLAISFFTVISGKPLDGLLLVIVAAALSWDAGMRARELQALQAARVQAGLPPGYLSETEPAQPSAWRARSERPRLRLAVLGMGGAVIYSLTVGSFTRFSWPATAGVVGLGAGVVIVGWGGPTRHRQIPGRFSRLGMWTWSSLLVAGGLWELAALLEQPSIDRSSWAHPTISTLTDPLLASWPGRAVALLAWVSLGCYLVER